MFTLNHDDPGALCDVLVKFKEYGITLTSINSRPANLKPWQYVFFVEMIGDIHQEGLVEKKESCLELVILGVFKEVGGITTTVMINRKYIDTLLHLFIKS